MKSFKIWCIVIATLLLCSNTQAAIFYVGDSAQCNQSNHYSNLDEALLAAAINGNQADEIRLTNTISYQGNNFGSYTLSLPSAGHITIAGGYGNCGDPMNSAPPIIGNTDHFVFEIKNNSLISLKNLQITGSASRGIIVNESASVYLENVDVSDNVAGIRILGGAYVEVDENSIVVDNGHLDDISKGGGIWCFGNNSEVAIAGKLEQNSAVSGGNMYIEDGCFATLEGGANIKGGLSNGMLYSAHYGGGIMVHDGGELLADGDEDRVLITDHRAIYDGGGVYVYGTGKATLINTLIARNMTEDHGAGLYVTNGGTSGYQVVMDRAETCPFIISCSEFEENTFISELVYINNSKVKISRTLFDSNEQFHADNEYALINVRPGAVLHMSHSNMLANDSDYLFFSTGTTEVSHHTAARNYSQPFSGSPSDSYVWWSSLGNLRFENSIFQNTQGGFNAPTTSPNISGKCNLIDNGFNWPGDAYTIGTAQFINASGGDARQVASSDGVDMCLEDTFAWSTNRDIEYQTSPVNENTNPQGLPGEVGGLYDAGFDEVYDNIGADEFLLTVQKEGSGSGFVISDPLGISCGSDCTEVVFNGTLVKLTATGTSNSDFIGWRSCPLPNGNDCFVTVTESQTIFAEFQPDDLIFSDSFE